MISIITPVFNQFGITHHFLFNNHRLYHARPDIEFVIVDNGSQDSTAQILRQWVRRMGEQKLRVLTNVLNHGFGPGNNQGANVARGDTFIFINNDTVPTGDYVAEIEADLEAYPDGLIGAELFNFDTGWNTFSGETIPYLAGWCLACQRETWQALGGFDERFVPCDYEDMDLSKTAAEQGIPLVQTSLPLIHNFGSTSSKLDGGRENITLKNQRLFMEKWNLLEPKSPTSSTA